MVDFALDLGITTIAELLVAFGTILLAYMTWRTVVEVRRQLSLQSAQVAIFRSQLDPYLLVRNLKFEGNRLILDVENIGKGPATWLGVEAWFALAEPRYSADSKGAIPLTNELLEDKRRDGGMVYVKYEAIAERNIYYKEWKRANPTAIVTFLPNKSVGDEAILLAGERQHFEIEPHFGIVKAGEGGPTSAPKQVFLTFDEFSAVLEDNHVKFPALHFEILCKDSVDNDVPGVRLCKFVMELEVHKTLEEGYRTAHGFDFVSIGLREFSKQVGYMDAGMYHDLKSAHNIPEPWRKKQF